MEINRTIKLPEGCTEIKIRIGTIDDEPDSRPCLGYISFVDRNYQDGDYTREIVDDQLMVDFDKDGRVRGIEILL